MASRARFARPRWCARLRCASPQLDQLMKDQGKQINAVVEFAIDDKVLLERITGRRVHPGSGRSYHVRFNPPKVEGKDDVRGSAALNSTDHGRAPRAAP
jgi:adenylate kinase